MQQPARGPLTAVDYLDGWEDVARHAQHVPLDGSAARIGGRYADATVAHGRGRRIGSPSGGGIPSMGAKGEGMAVVALVTFDGADARGLVAFWATALGRAVETDKGHCVVIRLCRDPAPDWASSGCPRARW